MEPVAAPVVVRPQSPADRIRPVAPAERIVIEAKAEQRTVPVAVTAPVITAVRAPIAAPVAAPAMRRGSGTVGHRAKRRLRALPRSTADDRSDPVADRFDSLFPLPAERLPATFGALLDERRRACAAALGS